LFNFEKTLKTPALRGSFYFLLVFVYYLNNMRFSQLFTKTFKEAPAGETAVNAKFLERGGFVYKNSAGVYSFLPLGWRVMQKIIKIIKGGIS